MIVHPLSHDDGSTALGHADAISPLRQYYCALCCRGCAAALYISAKHSKGFGFKSNDWPGQNVSLL